MYVCGVKEEEEGGGRAVLFSCSSFSSQVWQLLRGFYEAVPRELLSVFDYQELELLMCGLPGKISDGWMMRD